ncbi:MAG: chemotaxis protein CheD [Pseudomonadales bacterium]|nr:chemotaxis protein CheD [Pseudomonadales bacterium]
MKMTSADVSSLVLMPGDIYFGDANIVLKTLLGSCVSIVLWHPKLKLGGMCHFVLPRRLHPGGESLDGRYADEAVQLFMADLTRQRTLPEDYRVHVFGGANMFHGHNQTCTDFTRAPNKELCDGCSLVSCRNQRAAATLLDRYGFEVSHSDLGGTNYRQLSFNIANGSIVMHKDSVDMGIQQLGIA